VRIKEITSQSRRDFTAILVCEHCEELENLNTGYDDAYYHSNVIPSMVCKKCGKKAKDSYRPLTTKYDASVVI